MKRDELIRRLRAYAHQNDVSFVLDKRAGQGSHYKVSVNGVKTIVKSGDLGPHLVDGICKQLGIDSSAI